MYMILMALQSWTVASNIERDESGGRVQRSFNAERVNFAATIGVPTRASGTYCGSAFPQMIPDLDGAVRLERRGDFFHARHLFKEARSMHHTPEAVYKQKVSTYVKITKYHCGTACCSAKNDLGSISLRLSTPGTQCQDGPQRRVCGLSRTHN